jgi:hypothetical protein
MTKKLKIIIISFLSFFVKSLNISPATKTISGKSVIFLDETISDNRIEEIRKSIINKPYLGIKLSLEDAEKEDALYIPLSASKDLEGKNPI